MPDLLQTTTRAELYDRITALNARYAAVPAAELMGHVLNEEFSGEIVLVSSFGAESSVLLSLAAEADPDVPVLFLDTRRHFPETLDYLEMLRERLGLTNIRIAEPRPADIEADDPDGQLAERDADRCCYIRKTLPMIRNLSGYRAWITGRKRFQNAERARLDLFEVEERWIKVNPLADWTPEDIAAHMRRLDLPVHPLVPLGFPSIGCYPCTAPVAAGENPRAGRWAGQEKTECGIHGQADGPAETDGPGKSGRD